VCGVSAADPLPRVSRHAWRPTLVPGNVSGVRGTAIAVVLLVAGCSDDVDYGEVQVIDTGAERVQLRACIDGKLFDCNGEDTVLIGEHAGQSTEMKFSGLFFPEHAGFLELGDRTKPFVVREGNQRVEMLLPPAFDVIGAPAEPLGPSDRVELTWRAAEMGMRWDVGYACPADIMVAPRKTGSVAYGTIDDDGSVELAMDTVVRALDADHVTMTECAIEVQFSRVREGSVDDGFRASRGTAITRRTVNVPFVR
jgi:hypothetical protein